MDNKRVRLYVLLASVVLCGPSAYAAASAIPWERVPGVRIADFKPDLVARVETLLQEFRAYGKCTETVAACLRRNPPSVTAQRLARDVFTLMSKGATRDQAAKWVEMRARMATTPDVHSFKLDHLTPLGNRDAPVTIVEFSDFQCPSCARAAPMLEELVRRSKGKARLYFKQFPLKTHPDSVTLARACLGAGALGKFWELCPKLFELGVKFSEERLFELARSVGLDPEKLKAESQKDAVVERITDDKMEGLKNMISATPAIYINGKELLLPPTPELLQDRLEEELDLLAGKA